MLQGLTTPLQGTTQPKANASFTASVTQARSFGGKSEQAPVETFNLGQPVLATLLASGKQTAVTDESVDTANTEQQTSDSENAGEATVIASVLSDSIQNMAPAQGNLGDTVNTAAQTDAAALQANTVSMFKGFTEHKIQGTAELNNVTAGAQNQPALLAASLVTTQAVTAETSNPKTSPIAIDSSLISAVNNELGNATIASQATQTNQPSTTAISAITAESKPEWAAVHVDTKAGKWGEQMLQVLHDRVTLQAQQNMQEAKIRLDPPDLGKLDLVVRVEGDRLSVQINANTAATREALMQVSDRLRTELQEQNFVHVDVNVGSDQRGQQQDQTFEEQSSTIFAANEASSEPSYTPLSEHWLSTQA